MNLLSPEPGLLLWTGFTFLLLLFILTRYAWKPILSAIRSRDERIGQALNAAQKATEELRNIEQTKARIVNEAKVERDKLLNEARELKDSILAEARQIARTETERMIEMARQQINKEKTEAVYELKKQVARLSVSIAEKVLTDELSNQQKQQQIIEKYLNESHFN
jgi:F-type H+-transporting ATPase subunit b